MIPPFEEAGRTKEGFQPVDTKSPVRMLNKMRAAEDHLDHFSLLQGTQAISEILQSAVAVGA